MANSLMQLVSDGALSVVPLTIKFFEKDHISVYIDEVPLPTADYSYAWSGASTITITPAVALGIKVTIRRRTPADYVLHDFQAGAVFSEVSVDDNFRQELFLLQEAREQSVVTDLYNGLNMHGTKITNMAEGTSGADAITLKQAQLLVSGGMADVTLREDMAKSDGFSYVGETTYAGIRAYSGTGTRMRCHGRTHVFDRAEGFFYVDPEDHTSIDDDGTILVDAMGRRWKRQYSDWVTPTWWGASGIDDDSDCILALEAAASRSRYVYLLPGTYGVSRPWVLLRERMHVKGAGTFGVYGTATPIGGTGGTELKALDNFVGAEVAGSAGRAVMWYGNPNGNWNDTSWIEGGIFEGFSIACRSLGVEGIRVNRVCNGHVFRDITVSNPSIGIYGTHFGWLTSFDNVFIYQPSIIGIRLTGAYNGCSFTGCGLYGGNITTEVLLDLSNDSFGNSWHGGFIEGGRVGVRLNRAQISFFGTDFEVLTERFFEVRGTFVDGLLAFANPPITVSGCTFVGVPSMGGFYVNGGFVKIDSSFFINNEGLPPSNVYCLNGVLGADSVPGFASACIAEENNVWRGWGTQISTGIVFSRFKHVATEGVTFPSVAVPSGNPNTLDDYREGVFTPAMAGTGWGSGMVATGRYTKIGNLVTIYIQITGTTNASEVTSSFLVGLPFSVGTNTCASICDSYNTSYGTSAVIATPTGGQIYMPTIAPTAATITITTAYLV